MNVTRFSDTMTEPRPYMSRGRKGGLNIKPVACKVMLLKRWETLVDPVMLILCSAMEFPDIWSNFILVCLRGCFWMRLTCDMVD